MRKALDSYLKESRFFGDTDKLCDDDFTFANFLKAYPKASEDELVEMYIHYSNECYAILKMPIVWSAIGKVAAALVERGKLTGADVVQAIGKTDYAKLIGLAHGWRVRPLKRACASIPGPYPQYAGAFYNRGTAHQAQGELARAIDDYDEAIRRRVSKKEADVPTISIVDDDESVREATKGLVRSLGYDAVAFASAEKFLNFNRVHDTACVVTGVEMPGGLSGIELQSRLAEEGHQIPIIFITAYYEERVRRRAKEAGAFGFFSKPFDANLFIGCLNRAVSSTTGDC